MKIRSFEDLDVYKKAREYRMKIYQIVRELPKEEQYALGSQMRRAAVSITNNIAEGFGRYHFQENIQFCRHSRGSVNEILDDINACLDEGYIAKEHHATLKKEGNALIKLINGYIASLKRNREKFKNK